MKPITWLLFVGLLATSGCLSTRLINDHARPHPEYSEPAQQMTEAPGQPGYYALLPLTLAGDVMTAPFQIGYFMFTADDHWGVATIDGVPVPLP